ncbi:hypothetical protein ACFX10_030754 [Malus domestica]
MRPSIQQAIQVLNFEVPLPILPPIMPMPMAPYPILLDPMVYPSLAVFFLVLCYANPGIQATTLKTQFLELNNVKVRGPSLLSLIYSSISVFNFPSQLALSLLLAAISITWLLGSPLQRDSVALFKTLSWNFTSTILVDPHEIYVSTDNTTSIVLAPLLSLIASTSKPKSGNDQRID